MFLSLLSGSLLSEIIVVLAIILVIFLIFKIGKFLLRIIFGVIANSILGVISIFAVNYFFGIGIPLTLPILAAVALFGLPGTGTIIILKMLGVSLA